MMMNNKNLKQSIYNKIRKSKFLKNFDFISSDDDFDLFTPTIIKSNLKNSRLIDLKNDFAENDKKLYKNGTQTYRSSKIDKYFIPRENESTFLININLDNNNEDEDDNKSLKYKKKSNLQNHRNQSYRNKINNENYLKNKNIFHKKNNYYNEEKIFNKKKI